MSITKARKIQLGRESSAGTPVASTTVWNGPAAFITDGRELTIPNENVGLFGPSDRGYFPTTIATLALPETELTFEQFNHILEMGIETDAAAANGGTTSAYIYEYVTALSSANTLKHYTVEAGNDQQAHEMEYSYVTDMSLTGAPRQAWMVSANITGRQKSLCTFTAGQTAPAVEEALFGKSKIYLDASGGTIGSTQKTSTWIGASINLATGLMPVFTGDGDLYYTFVKQTGADLTGSLTLEYDTVGVAQEAVFVAGSTQLMRIDIIGSALSGSGGTHATKLIRLDAAIKILSVDTVSSMDGNDTVSYNWRAVWGNAGITSPTFTVVNLLATVP